MSATRLMFLMCCSTKTVGVLLLGLGLLSHEARAQTTTRETASVSRVLQLGRENFDQIVFSEFEAVSTMVFFHTSWCAACKAPMKIWEQLATTLHADPDSRSVQIAAVDCDRNGRLCQNLGVGEYPLVKVFHYRGDNRSKLVWRGDDASAARTTKEKDPQFQGTPFRFKDGKKFSGAELHKHALLLRKPCGFFTPRQCGAKEKKAIQEYAKLTLEGKEAKMRELAKEEIAGLEKRYRDLLQKTLEEEKVAIPERLRVEVQENEKYTRVIAAKREQLRRQAALEQKKANEELLRKQQLGTTADSSSAGAGDPEGDSEEDEDEEEDGPQPDETAEDEELLQPVALSAEDEKLLKEVEKLQRGIQRPWKKMQKELRKLAKRKELAVKKKQLLKEGLERDAKAKRLHVRLEAGADGKDTDSAAWVVVDLAKEALANKAKQMEQELEDMDKEDEDVVPAGAPPSRVGKRGAPLSEGLPQKGAKSNGMRAEKPAKPQAHRKNVTPKAEKPAKPRGDQKEVSKADQPAPQGEQGPSQKKTGTTREHAQNTNKKAKKAVEKKKLQPAVEIPPGEGITALHWGALGAGGETEQEQVPEPPRTDPSQHHHHVPNKDETESDELAKVAMEQMKAKVMEENEKEEKSKPPLVFRAGDDEREEVEMGNDETRREGSPGKGLPEGFAKSSRKVKEVERKATKQKPKHEL